MDIEVVFPGGKKVDALYGEFRIRTDQPVKDGGEGAAPSPFHLFLASIATCAGIYTLNFCQARGISNENVKLLLRPRYSADKKMIDKISIVIQVPVGFPGKYMDALIKTVNLCAVKKHIQDPPEFETIIDKITR